MAQEKRRKKNWTKDKVGCTENHEGMDARKKITDAPGRQNGNKGRRRRTAAISEEGEDNSERHQMGKLRRAITSGKSSDLEPVIFVTRTPLFETYWCEKLVTTKFVTI
jgi:hypothetical protein